MSLFSKIRGTAELLLQLGKGGPQWKNDTASAAVVLGARTLDDTAFVNVRGADPLIDDDLTTKRYTDEQIEAVEHRIRALVLHLAELGIEVPEELLA